MLDFIHRKLRQSGEPFTVTVRTRGGHTHVQCAVTQVEHGVLYLLDQGENILVPAEALDSVTLHDG